MHTRQLTLATFFALLSAAALAAPEAAAQKLTTQVAPHFRDCGYAAADATSAAPSAGERHLIFPDDELFRPPLADPKAPRFYAGAQQVDFDDEDGLSNNPHTTSFVAAVVAFGGTMGIYSWRPERDCDGWQISIDGVVTSQFNLQTPSGNLINSDFRVGLPVTWRQGRWAARLRVYHESTHLGDDFVRYNAVEPVDFGYEAAELLGSLRGDWWRVYAGGAFLFHVQVPLERAMAQLGAEARGPTQTWLSPDLRWVPVAGVDLTSYAARDWGVTASARAGLELASELSGHRARVLLVYLDGAMPWGQFVDDKRLRSYGIEGQMEL